MDRQIIDNNRYDFLNIFIENVRMSGSLVLRILTWQVKEVKNDVMSMKLYPRGNYPDQTLDGRLNASQNRFEVSKETKYLEGSIFFQ